jgi:hypothetical protein
VRSEKEEIEIKRAGEGEIGGEKDKQSNKSSRPP